MRGNNSNLIKRFVQIVKASAEQIAVCKKNLDKFFDETKNLLDYRNKIKNSAQKM